MNISEFQKQVHELAKEKGWWDTERSPLEAHMLMVSELAEATEEARKGSDPIYYPHPTPVGADVQKPEGELIELADCVIRVMDYCEAKGWDLSAALEIKHSYNKTRPHRHGNKRY